MSTYLKPLSNRSLREDVYRVLRDALDHGELKPGETIDLKTVEKRLGVSRTPLREALLRLENEGFVVIKPRSGVIVKMLTEADIRNLYQMIGALEASVLLSESQGITAERVRAMRRHNDVMKEALLKADFDRYYAANLALHDSYLNLSDNRELVRQVRIMKQRLYDFPKKRDLLLEWEIVSTQEHDDIISRLEDGDTTAAAEIVRDVHWSYAAQERFIRKYYREELEVT